jgi:hypothetical protein
MGQRTPGGKERFVFVPKIPPKTEEEAMAVTFLKGPVEGGRAEERKDEKTQHKEHREVRKRAEPRKKGETMLSVGRGREESAVAREARADGEEFSEADLTEKWHPRRMERATAARIPFDLEEMDGDILLQLPRMKKTGRYITGKIEVHENGEAFLILGCEPEADIGEFPLRMRLVMTESTFPQISFSSDGPILRESYLVRKKAVAFVDL